jgi:8-oxo-dGTP diphosphatase
VERGGGKPGAPGPDVVPVVAAVIERAGRYLVGLRPAHKRHGGMWEFPGGKLLTGEGFPDAARRELREELGLDVEAVGDVLFEAVDPGSPFRISFIEIRVRGEPSAHEHERLEWCTPETLRSLPMAPTDALFVRVRWEARTGSREV